MERNRAGALLAAPPPIVPVMERLIAAIDPAQWERYTRKRDHAARRRGRREWFHGAWAEELLREGRAVPPGASAPPPRQERPRQEQPRPERPRQERPRERPAPPPPPPRPEPPPPQPPPPAPPPEPLPHEVLGVAPGAPREEVERAFKELAKRYHPDKFAGLDPEFQALAEEKFKRIAAARDALGQGG